jgi:hypothetical protein
MTDYGIFVTVEDLSQWNNFVSYLQDLQNNNKETIEVSGFFLSHDYAILSLNNDMSKINEIEKELNEKFEGLKITTVSRTKLLMD